MALGSDMTKIMYAALAAFATALFAATLATPARSQDAVRAPNRQLIGEFALAGSFSNGNTERKSIDLDGKAVYRAGRVEDKYKAQFAFADNGAITIAKRYMFGAQSSIDIQDGLYGFGYGNYEDDRFTGYNYELDGGIGAGYRIIRTENALLSFEAGPGYRYSKLPGLLGKEKKLYARGTLNFEYIVNGNFKVDNETMIRWDSIHTRIDNTFAVTSKFTTQLSGRMQVEVRHNSKPPLAGINKTDTVTKAGVVYSF